MVKLKEIPRTATFAFSVGGQTPQIVTGTVAGAVDADFSSSSTLELWDLDLAGKSSSGNLLDRPKVSLSTDARFHDVIWGGVSASRPKGLIATAQENGALTVWDPDALTTETSPTPLLKKTQHSGAIKSIDFNKVQANLIASAGAKGEIYILDLDKPNTPITPGTTSSRLGDIESVSWNSTVAHILATAGSTNSTSVWDLKNRREILHLYYPGSTGSGRHGVSSVVWNPENSTKLITACEDDSNPVILMWDLRNSNAPERILKGHNQGVLSLSWCVRDVDLLLSSGKDNRTLLWNPQSGEMLGEFPIATNWTFQTSFFSHNPDVFASASFDGKVVVQTLQNTNKAETAEAAPKPEGNDFWNSESYTDTQQPTFSLNQPPKWLRRPIGASFGFGGKFVTLQVDSKTHKSDVKIRKFIIEPSMAAETKKFATALEGQNLVSIAEARSANVTSEKEKNDWKVLLALYESNPKKKIIDLLGYTSKELEDVLNGFKGLSIKDSETAVNGIAKEEKPNATEGLATSAEPANSMFVGETGGADFFNSITDQSTSKTEALVSKSPSTASSGVFTIFDAATDDADKRITQAIILGDFLAAVDIALKFDRLSDAFMLALSGDDACRKKVQAAFFEQKKNGPSYVRVLSAIVGKNLDDLVANANIVNWKEVVVALCTFSTDAEFGTLISELGSRLDAARASKSGDDALELRKSAALCYLAGAKLESLVDIWIEELMEAEQAALAIATDDLTPFGIHIKSLQDFIEKVTVFRNAVKYTDLGNKKDGSNEWHLARLYEAYKEYANIVASQGFLDLAHRYLVLLPTQYPLASLETERVSKANTSGFVVSAKTQMANTGYSSYMPALAAPVAAAAGYSPYTPLPEVQTASPYQPYQPQTATQAASVAPPMPMYAQATSGAAQPYGHAYRSSLSIPAPPPVITSPPHLHHIEQPPLPPPPVTSHQSGTKDVGGWNDAPVLKASASRKQTPAPAAQPIMAPFPGQAPYNPNVPLGPSSYAPPVANSATPPSFNRPPVTIAPPPTNARAPQSIAPSPMQTPATQPAAAAPPKANLYAPPQVEFVSGLASAYAPTTAPAVSNGPSPVPNRYAPAGPAPASQAPVTVNPYAPPPPSSMPSRPPNPYAPVPSSTPVATMAAPPQQHSAPPTGNFVPPPVTPRPEPSPRPVSPAQSVVAESLSGAPHAVLPPSKYPPGDRSHISAEAMTIVELLSAEMARVKQKVPASVSRQVADAEKRMNILFDHLNNNDLLTAETVREMIILAQALAAKDFDTAQAVQVNLVTTRMDECGQWMVGIRRLIEMSRHTATV
ncbi:uncharacterized protein V1518DRAFT_419425 [Limtongia smithiae]|uniref:uncharacterized protein n=1 Tax=Limtongia smithiae TaxID=1125753 RepID=UPI0034CDCECA